MLDELYEKDIQQLIRLSESVGWDYDESEIRTIMISGLVYGHKTMAGEIVSCAAIIPYGDNLASLGMVIVHPNYRRLGLGKEVTIRCIQSVPRSVPIMLIATPEGKPMYERLGFKSVDSIQKYLCDSYHPPRNTDVIDYSFAPYHPSHLPGIIKLDQSACGANRKKFLSVRVQQAKQAITVQNREGDIVGYAFSIQGTVNLIIGPVVAPNYKVASHLLHKLAIANESRLRIDIPKEQGEFGSILVERGFQMVSSPPIMLLNGDDLPARDRTLFGIAAQVFG
ncbi:GNAT family N-acetyltransferase [Alicyclobacillus fastidiosus]|uniref:GNAT family N-acetyltransferase n=1 Tax=Alicyclobacillus fastidiosus TaxID=392011 RepID=UPI0024E11B9D|nr:GNAT family N-acetyltransferase [Alicyclobacillus fastidiosus]